MPEYLPIDAESVDLECVLRSNDFLRVQARWSHISGPSELAGELACEIELHIGDDVDVLIVTEGNNDVDLDFVKAICKVYGIRGSIHSRTVSDRALTRLNTFTLR